MNNDKIKLEKEKKDYNHFVKVVDEANHDADKKGAQFSGSNDAKDTAKEAKKAADRMKEAQRANRNLASSKKKIEGLEKDIKKAEDRIAKLNQQIEFTDKNGKKINTEEPKKD